ELPRAVVARLAGLHAVGAAEAVAAELAAARVAVARLRTGLRAQRRGEAEAGRRDRRIELVDRHAADFPGAGVALEPAAAGAGAPVLRQADAAGVDPAALLARVAAGVAGAGPDGHVRRRAEFPVDVEAHRQAGLPLGRVAGAVAGARAWALGGRQAGLADRADATTELAGGDVAVVVDVAVLETGRLAVPRARRKTVARPALAAPAAQRNQHRQQTEAPCERAQSHPRSPSGQSPDGRAASHRIEVFARTQCARRPLFTRASRAAQGKSAKIGAKMTDARVVGRPIFAVRIGINPSCRRAMDLTVSAELRYSWRITFRGGAS